MCDEVNSYWVSGFICDSRLQLWLCGESKIFDENIGFYMYSAALGLPATSYISSSYFPWPTEVCCLPTLRHSCA
jgi:hypothetical protein